MKISHLVEQDTFSDILFFMRQVVYALYYFTSQYETPGQYNNSLLPVKLIQLYSIVMF